MKTQVALGACAVLLAGLGIWALRPAQEAAQSPGAQPNGSRWEGAAAAPESAGDGLLPPEAAPAPAVQMSPFLRQLGSMLAAAGREADADRKEQLLENLAAWIEGSDAGAAIKFLSEQEPSEFIDELQGRLLQQWTDKAPQAAANAALEMSGRDRREALGTVLGVWAAGRLSEAIAWVDRLPEGEEKQNAHLSVAREASRTEPQTALEIASKLPASSERDDLIAHAAAQWAATSPESAGAWAREIEDIALRNRLLAMIATAWGDSDPAAAAALALDWLPPGKPQNDALVSIVQRWTQKDPGAVAVWVGRFPEGALRDAAMENVVKLWVNQDTRAVGEWLNTLPPGPGRDSGLRAYAEQIAPRFPGNAASWVGAITDPTMRTAQFEMIARMWIQSDPTAATAWIWKTPFSPETRSRLLAR